MRTARPLGLSPDGRSLIVVLDGGEQVAIPADDRLRAALRNDRARMGQLEIEMESALRPRDIQARIRAGESLEAVAQAAGVPVEQIEPFAAPVIAEREHIAGLAQTAPVRRPGDAVAHRSLRAVVTDRLLSRGVDVDSVDWNAWRSGERRWTLRLSYESGSAHREADFTYDQTGRFSVAANDDARWLTGESSRSHGPQPGRKRRGDDPELERTLALNDELAIVRAIQPQFAVTPDLDDDADLVEADDLEPDDSPDNEDAFAEGDLEEVDGVYDIVPGDRSNLDVLYDMLSSFDEDSVQIYAGLVRPAAEQPAAPVLPEAPAGEPEHDDAPDAGAPATAHDEDAAFAEARIVRSDNADEPFVDDPGDTSGLPSAPGLHGTGAEPEPVVEPAEPQPVESESASEPDETPAAEATGEPAAEASAEAASADAVAAPPAEPAEPVVTEPEQPSLVDEAVAEPSRPIKRKRASVPSWDEIMFGAPKPKQ